MYALQQDIDFKDQRIKNDEEKYKKAVAFFEESLDNHIKEKKQLRATIGARVSSSGCALCQQLQELVRTQQAIIETNNAKIAKLNNQLEDEKKNMQHKDAGMRANRDARDQMEAKLEKLKRSYTINQNKLAQKDTIIKQKDYQLNKLKHARTEDNDDDNDRSRRKRRNRDSASPIDMKYPHRYTESPLASPTAEDLACETYAFPEPVAATLPVRMDVRVEAWEAKERRRLAYEEAGKKNADKEK